MRISLRFERVWGDHSTLKGHSTHVRAYGVKKRIIAIFGVDNLLHLMASEGAAVPGADGERDGRVTAGGGVELPTSGAGRLGPTGAARPLVLPETFDGTGSWSEWCYHFENVAAVNGWDGAQKLQWLRVRVTGRAQKALHRLSGPAVATYEATRDALTARFEPVSRHTRYQAEFQLHRKKSAEGWADFADDLRNLADKAYPTLQEEAKERLSLNSYLAQLPQPQISFSVRQKQPATLDEAVAATIEMESYFPPSICIGCLPGRCWGGTSPQRGVS